MKLYVSPWYFLFMSKSLKSSKVFQELFTFEGLHLGFLISEEFYRNCFCLLENVVDQKTLKFFYKLGFIKECYTYWAVISFHYVFIFFDGSLLFLILNSIVFSVYSCVSWSSAWLLHYYHCKSHIRKLCKM